MGIVSYAQNLEDVLLWRALGDVPDGLWIDVGAADPSEYSVTRAFYDRGWSGVNVEPQLSYFERLVAARPRDTNLQLAVGAEPGEQLFHDVDGTGLSTLDADVARTLRNSQFTVAERIIEVVTLAELCRVHTAGRDIHFLKIDVEGAESEVIRSGDFAAYRPWIVLVEATRPGTQEPSHEAWEPLLLEAGYRFAWFDGAESLLRRE